MGLEESASHHRFGRLTTLGFRVWSLAREPNMLRSTTLLFFKAHGCNYLSFPGL